MLQTEMDESEARQPCVCLFHSRSGTCFLPSSEATVGVKGVGTGGQERRRGRWGRSGLRLAVLGLERLRVGGGEGAKQGEQDKLE